MAVGLSCWTGDRRPPNPGLAGPQNRAGWGDLQNLVLTSAVKVLHVHAGASGVLLLE